MKRHSACDEMGLFLTIIAINALVKEFLCRTTVSNINKVAPHSNYCC
jgi:hypothetical protein